MDLILQSISESGQDTFNIYVSSNNDFTLNLGKSEIDPNKDVFFLTFNSKLIDWTIDAKDEVHFELTKEVFDRFVEFLNDPQNHIDQIADIDGNVLAGHSVSKAFSGNSINDIDVSDEKQEAADSGSSMREYWEFKDYDDEEYL